MKLRRYHNGMRLLIVTQVVDSTDPFLGFFHGWLEELSKHFEHIHVICLKEGEHKLPANVTVHSLGKEGGVSRGKYVFRFLGYVWKLRGEYDTVFVHMNQEYILLAGWLWKLLGKRMYMWRNHYAGGFLTDVAAKFCKKVFCTSKFSYTAKYQKTVLMPLGIDTELFLPDSRPVRTPRSILFFGRFTPAKRPDVLLEALRMISDEKAVFTASFYGTALPQDATYKANLVRRSAGLGFGERVKFFEGVPHAVAPSIFNRHEIYVNLSSSGTYDKTMLEAAACGCVVIAASKDFAALAGERYLVAEDAKAVADKLRELLALSDSERMNLASELRVAVLKGQSLKTLGERLMAELRPQ